jgi:hypothetical protein
MSAFEHKADIAQISTNIRLTQTRHGTWRFPSLLSGDVV